MHTLSVIRYDRHGLPSTGALLDVHGPCDPFAVAIGRLPNTFGAWPDAAPIGAQRAQNPPQGPAIAPRSLEANERALRAPAGRRPASLQRSDPLMRVHWGASLALFLLMLNGFTFPLLGGLMYVTWELHLAAWLLQFVSGQ